MEKKDMQINEKKNEGFFTKLKNGFMKFFKGIKNFFIKTGRVNSSNCYGFVDGYGDFIVYTDHALFSAVGREDIVFTAKDVRSWSFEGIGKIRRKRATVKYSIEIDSKVLSPNSDCSSDSTQKVNALIFISKEISHLYGHGFVSATENFYSKCDVYGYDSCLIIVLKLEKQVGDKIEKYEESLQYPLSDIKSIIEVENKDISIKLKDKKTVVFKPQNSKIIEELKKIEIKTNN